MKVILWRTGRLIWHGGTGVSVQQRRFGVEHECRDKVDVSFYLDNRWYNGRDCKHLSCFQKLLRSRHTLTYMIVHSCQAYPSLNDYLIATALMWTC